MKRDIHPQFGIITSSFSFKPHTIIEINKAIEPLLTIETYLTFSNLEIRYSSFLKLHLR